MVVNPAAGGGRAGQLWPACAAALRRGGCVVQEARSGTPAGVTELTRRALREGWPTVVAVGGDGTANLVANGFFADNARGEPINPAACFGLIPCGTSNDLAHGLGLPHGQAAVATLLAGRGRVMDVGRVAYGQGGGVARHFLNVADLGLGGHAVRRAARLPRALGGKGAFLVAAVWTALAHHDVPVRVFVGDDARGAAVDLALLVVANGQAYGGGMRVAPMAQWDDGLLEVLWAGGVSRPRLLLDLIPRVYRGAHLGRPGVAHHTVTSVRVTSECELLLQVDGEVVGDVSPEATFSVLPGALRVLTPPAVRLS